MKRMVEGDTHSSFDTFEMLAHQECPVPRASQRPHIAGRKYAALAHRQHVRGNTLRKAQGGVQVDRKRAQIAVIDADERGLQRQSRLELARVVHLDEHRHAK